MALRPSTVNQDENLGGEQRGGLESSIYGPQLRGQVAPDKHSARDKHEISVPRAMTEHNYPSTKQTQSEVRGSAPQSFVKPRVHKDPVIVAQNGPSQSYPVHRQLVNDTSRVQRAPIPAPVHDKLCRTQEPKQGIPWSPGMDSIHDKGRMGNAGNVRTEAGNTKLHPSQRRHKISNGSGRGQAPAGAQRTQCEGCMTNSMCMATPPSGVHP